jgi:hypothetical protein
MYKTGRRFACLLTCVIPLLLTGCGGGAADKGSDTTINKPAPSSSAISSMGNATSDANSSNLTSNSSAPAPASSSGSSVSTYQRSSRDNSSASVSTGETDTTPPSSTKLFPHKFAISSLTILWDHATDDTGVFEYQIERNGELIATLEFPSFVYTDKGLTPNTNYTYSIRAVDQAGNVSEKSNELNVRTLAITGTTLSSSGASSSTGINSSISQASNSSQQSSESSTPPSSSFNSTHSNSSQQTSVNSESSAPSSSGISSSQQGSSVPQQSSSSSSDPSIAHLRWEHPKYRANGDYLELHEIAGYELRKKNKITLETIYLVIESNTQTEFIITDLTGGDAIDIAVFDTNGLYSDFIPIYPR